MRRLAAPVPSSLVGLLPSFAGKVVVVAGDFVADEYLFAETERISREAPVLILRYERSELRAGCAGNAARNLAALGVQVRVVGVVGDDAPGAALIDMLERSQVDVRGIQRVRGRATEVKTRILAGGHSTRRQQMLRLDRSPQPLPEPAVRRLVADLERTSRGASAALASDYGSGTLGLRAIQYLRRLCRSGVPVCVDSRYRLAEFTDFTMVKPNEPELEAASGVSLSRPDGLERAARLLLRRLRCQHLLVTRGHNGMSLFSRGSRPLHLPAHATAEAGDVTGAGDTVAATFCAALAAGAEAAQAAALANVAGALVVQKAGTATVPRRELLAALRRS